MKIFDVHSHIFPPNIAGKVIHELETYYGFLWQGSGLLDDLLRSLRSARIDRSVIFSCATKPTQVVSINNFISSLQNQYPELLIGFGTLHPDFENYREEIRRIKKLGLRGLKFHPDFQQFRIDDPKMMRIYEEVGDTLPMLFHMGDRRTEFSSPVRLANILEKLPHLTLIAAHMGGYSVWEESWKHLIGKPLYMDISSTIWVLSPQETRKMVLAHGVDRVLFASDYPAVGHRKAVEDVLSLGLSEKDNEKIFHKNAEKLFNIVLSEKRPPRRAKA